MTDAAEQPYVLIIEGLISPPIAYNEDPVAPR
jgi:hypothetical protein